MAISNTQKLARNYSKISPFTLYQLAFKGVSTTVQIELYPPTLCLVTECIAPCIERRNVTLIGFL